jgi:hypothetical protein
MRRRSFLASLAAGTAGLAGCSFASGDPTDASSPGDTTPADQSPTDTPPPAEMTPPDDSKSKWPNPPEEPASVVDLETLPRTYALSPTQFRTDDEAHVVLWFDQTATADHPARVQGWLENANDFPNTFRLQWIPVVGRTFSRQPQGYDHTARLHFVATDQNELTDGFPVVKQNNAGVWYAEDGGPEIPETYRMDAGERVALEYYLVGEREATERPTGVYEFRGDNEQAQVTVWDTTSPGPEEQSRFAGRSLPALDREGAVQWYHAADTESKAFVRPSTERLELDGLVSFEMVNNSRETLRCGHWNLYKLVDGEWFHVAPTVHTDDCRGLPAGGRKQWSLRAFNGEGVPCGSDGLTQGYLGGGEYGVVAGYGHPADASGALLELVGDSVDVVPTDDVTQERDGDTVVVTSSRYGDDQHPPDAVLTLRRADSADDRLIAEQIMAQGGFAANGRGLRNTLPALTEDVEQVVLRTDDHVVDSAVGYDTPTRRFRFRGQAYEVRRGGEFVDQS